MIIKRTKAPEPLPDGTYKVRILRIEPDESARGPIFKWHFKVTKGGEAGTKVMGITSRAWQAGSKLDRWLVAAGIKPVLGAEMDIADVIGHDVKITVTVEEYTGRDGAPRKRNRVQNVASCKLLSDDDDGAGEAERPAPKKKQLTDDFEEPRPRKLLRKAVAEEEEASAAEEEASGDDL